MCVCACTLVCVCVCVCSQHCQSMVKSFQPPPSICSPLSPSVFPLSSSPSLPPMNRLNFLMSCFYGLLMLIHSSPYALSLHSVVSCRSPPANHTLIFLISLLQQCLYETGIAQPHSHIHSHLYNALMSLHIYTCPIYSKNVKIEKKTTIFLSKCCKL